METFAAVFPSGALALFVLIVIALSLRARNAEFRRATWLALNAQPRLSIILGSVHTLTAVGAALLGIGLLHAGYAFGWGFFPLAAGQAFGVAFYAWIASRRWEE